MSIVATYFFQKSVFLLLLSAWCMDFVRIFSLVDIRPLFSVLLLPKVPIVLTIASNKNCIKLNFLKKSQWAHVFISSRSGARRQQRLLNILLFSNFFQKMYNFLRKRLKPFRGPKSRLKERRCLATKMNITFFMGNEFWIFFHTTIFSKKIIFLEKIGEKMLGGHENFLGEGVILGQKWI